MHTVERLEQLLAVAEQLGYQIRHEWLGAGGGGACEFGGRKWLFVDLALNALEQLEEVATALRDDPGIYRLNLPPEVHDLLGIRKAA